MSHQISISEYLYQLNHPKSVDIVGLCDDAACPECGYEFLYPKQNDMPVCPICGCRVDWTRWHEINDSEETT